MNAIANIQVEGLAKLRLAFPPNQISKLPKETGAQAKQRKAEIDKGNWPNKCGICGGFHHVGATHLDYVGHAALTDRLLDTDPEWTWEPVALDATGLPALDRNGGMWIRLTVLGVTRLGYGAADGKSGGDAVKEIIGDALRNAAMRFGAALDLWHKGDLHTDDADDGGTAQGISAVQYAELRKLLKEAASSEDAFVEWLKCNTLPELAADRFERAKKALTDRIASMAAEKAESAPASDILEDEIPY